MGILTWAAAGAVAAALARLLPPLRPARWRAEAAWAVLAAVIAGFCATALDFGGLDAIDPRAAAFSLVTGMLAIALYRMRYSHSNRPRRPDSKTT